MVCPGSVVLEADYPDSSSAYAAEGTCAHDLAACVLTDPASTISVGETKTVDGYQIEVTADMAAHVMDYCRLVREYGGTLMVEQRVPIGHLTGEEGAGGTSDVVIIKGTEIIVIDLKYGMGVKVDATDNPQLLLYALGALENFGLLADFDTVTMVIHQPRLNHVSEWSVPIQQVIDFSDEVRDAAHTVELAIERHGDIDFDWGYNFLSPGEKQCRFCRAKAICPALREEVSAISGPATAHDFAEFIPDVPSMETGGNYLSMAMSKVELVEQWCKGVRAEVERRLLGGQTVEGFKLVQGKQGNRKWADPEVAEALFKSMRLRQDEMYDLTLISPTTAEKVLKTSPKRWERVQPHIVRAEGKPSVAPATDKRPALAVQSVADDFRDIMSTAN